MKINEFRFLSNNESFIDKDFVNWSRCYEWGYVLNILKNKNNLKIHNTCAGPSEIHKSFHDKLVKTNNIVYNSDIFETEINKYFNNFYKYNILEENANKYDIVLCISTLEEMDSKYRKQGFDNLFNQLNDNGRLIITCDYPHVSIKELESFINSNCLDTNIRLNGSNSFYKQPEYNNLNIILLDIQKE